MSAERVAHAAEPLVDVDVGLRREHGEHQPHPLGGRQLDQPGHVDLAERVPTGHADELARVVVGPRVVGAREPPGVAAGLRGDERAPVAAEVQEGAGDAVVTAYHEHRTAGDLEGVEVTRSGEVAAHGDDQRHLVEDLVHLGLPALRVAVDGCRHLHRRVGLVGMVLLDVRDQPTGDVVVGSCCHRGRLPSSRWSVQSDNSVPAAPKAGAPAILAP